MNLLLFIIAFLIGVIVHFNYSAGNVEFEKLGVVSLTRKESGSISGGQNASEIQFLMDANGWSRAQACEVLGVAV